MDTNKLKQSERMDDLRVENYDAAEITTKKREVLGRMAVVGGAIVLTLGLFGLNSCIDRDRTEERGRPVDVMGGSGSWFVSVLERV